MPLFGQNTRSRLRREAHNEKGCPTMKQRFPLVAAIAAALLLGACSHDVEYYQKHTDEAKQKISECLKMDDMSKDKECNAATEALKKNMQNTVNNLMQMNK